MRSGKIRAFHLIVLAILALAIGKYRYDGTHPNGTRPACSPEDRAAVQSLIDKGCVHSVDVRNNEVRMDPTLWVPLTLEAKQGIVLLFSDYFAAAGATARVTILSDRNDTKLATYGAWGGMQILR